MKKITSFFTMLSIALSGVAQETTPNPETDYGTRLTPAQFNEITTPTKIAIECTQIDYYGQFYNGSGQSATLTENSIFVLEPVVEGTPGAYYIKKDNGTGENVYWGNSSANNTWVAKANAQQFNATSVSTMLDTKYADFATYGMRITFTDGTKWFRINKLDFPETSAAGVWTMQNVYKVSKVTINEVKDGATTTNVQYCLSSSKSYEIPQHVGYSYTVQAEGVAEDATSFTATNASDITVTVTYTAANPEAALASLQETLDEADDIAWGTTIGYYEKTDAIAKAIADAKELVEDESTDIDAIEEATVALKEAIAKPSLILPEAGKFYTIKGLRGGYLTGKASTAYSNRGKIGLVDDFDADYLFYYTEDSKLVCFGTGLALSHVAGGNHQAKVNGIAKTSPVVTFEKSFGSATAQGAKLFVKFADGHVIKDLSDGADRDDIGCNANTPEQAQWTIAEVTTLPLAISKAGYASFYAPVAVTMPAGLEAYVVESISGDVAMLKAVEGVVPANTGVILKGDEDDYELNITESNATVATELKGTVASAYVAGPAYVLSQPEGKEVGFYAALLNKNSEGAAATEGGTHFLANGFKAYLPAEGAASARLLFDFGTETAIESIQGAENANAVVYDLAGRRVKGAQKGLYIVNGKVVIK